MPNRFLDLVETEEAPVGRFDDLVEPVGLDTPTPPMPTGTIEQRTKNAISTADWRGISLAEAERELAEEDIQIPRRKSLGAALRHGVRRMDNLQVRAISGLGRQLAEIKGIEASALDPVFRWMFNIPKDINMDELLIGISEHAERDIKDFQRDYPETDFAIDPDAGYTKALWQVVSRPENLVQGLVESAPLVLEGTLGTILGGTVGGIALMAVPISGEVYSGARAEGTEPLPAFAQATLTGTLEAAIEQWTLGRKIGLVKNFRRIVSKGLPRVLWEGTKAFFRGTAEEGSQEFQRNFWQWLFTDRSQQWFNNVQQSMAMGGPLETLMSGGFAGAGAVSTPVSEKEARARVATLRKSVKESETLSPEQKDEIETELDKAEGFIPDIVEKVIEEKPAVPEKPGEVVTPTEPAKRKFEIRDMTPEEIAEDEAFWVDFPKIKRAVDVEAVGGVEDVLAKRIDLLERVKSGTLTQEEADRITQEFINSVRRRLPGEVAEPVKPEAAEPVEQTPEDAQRALRIFQMYQETGDAAILEDLPPGAEIEITPEELSTTLAESLNTPEKRAEFKDNFIKAMGMVELGEAAHEDLVKEAAAYQQVWGETDPLPSGLLRYVGLEKAEPVAPVEEDVIDVIGSKMVTETKTGGWKLQINELENGKYEVEGYWFPFIGEVSKPEVWNKIYNTQDEAQKAFDSIVSLKNIKSILAQPTVPEVTPVIPVEEVTPPAKPIEPISIGKTLAKQLRKAKKVVPEIAFEKSQELKKRVAAMAGTKEELIAKGVPSKEAIYNSTGKLAGRLTNYELRYDPIELSPEMEEAAYKSIALSKQLRPLTVAPTANAFEKLLAGSYLTWGEALLIQNHFGAELGMEARRRVPMSKKWYKLVPQWLGIWRTLLTAATGDVSGIGRQGLGAGIAHPVLFAKFAKEYVKGWAKEENAVKLNKMVMENPWLEEALSGRVKLDILKRGPGTIEPIERGEELIGAEPIEQIYQWRPKDVPVGKIIYPIAQLTRMAERGFVEGLNFFRISIYDATRTAQQETLKQMSEEDATKYEHLFNSEEATNRLKSLVNDATGRAWVKRSGAMKAIIPILSAGFAPRFTISRFRAPVRVAIESVRAGKRIIKGEPVNWAELRLTAGAMAGLTALVTIVGTAFVATAKMWGYDDDEVDFEHDPRSVHFGRIIIRNSAYDLAGGYQTSIRIAAQLASGQSKTQAGEIRKIDRNELLLRELRKKSRPIVSLVVDAWTGRTFWGERFGAPPKGKEAKALEAVNEGFRAIGLPELPPGVTKEVWQRTMGLAVQDLVDAYVVEGVPEGIVAGLLANAGVGVQTYEKWATSELVKKENSLAKSFYGMKWDELTAKQQKTLDPRLEKLRVKVGQEMAVKARSQFVTKEEEEVRNRIYDSLPKTVRDELYKIGVTNVGGLGRRWGDFYLNDERYAQYEKLAIPEIKKNLIALLTSNEYRKLKLPSEKRQGVLYGLPLEGSKTHKGTNAAKAKAREKLEEQMEAETRRRTSR